MKRSSIRLVPPGSFVATVVVALSATSCGSESSGTGPAGGAGYVAFDAGTGAASSSGGSGGVTGSGSGGATGGTTASGGTSATGGTTASGGTSATGGTTASGGGGSGGTGGASTGSGGATTSGSGGASAAEAGVPDGGDAAADAGPSPGVDASTDGSASTDGASGDGAGPRRGTGPGDWTAGDYPPDIQAQTYLEITGVPGQKGYTRQYKVRVPTGYDPDVPTPLVFCIHGLTQNPVMFCVTGAAMHDQADAEGFILVMPNGYQASWNAGTCCGGASTEQLDDVALFRAILGEVGKHVNVDLGRVYATGLSNGGFMSYRLACQASDLFAAVAPGAGAIGINSIGGGSNPASDFTSCVPTQRVSVLDIHGTGDLLVPYSLQAPSLALAVANDGCGTTPATATDPTSGGDTACVSYPDCKDGTEVTACSITGGGHCWFGSPDCGTGGGIIGAAVVGANSNHMVNNDAIWSFFQRHAR